MTIKRGILCVVLMAVAACSTWPSASNLPEKRSIAAAAAWYNRPAATLSSGALAQLSSSGKMNLSAAQLITDNNRAFQNKINMIESAKNSIDMVYFIYSDDFSSSYFTSKVIEAAKRGVQVRLLVDFITNYERLDFFNYMTSAGRNNISVRFYGVPSAGVLRSAVYQTLPCSKGPVTSATQCQAEKNSMITQLGTPETTWFSKMYLTGLYGRNAVLMQMAIGLGGQFDPKALKSQGGQATAEEKKQLKEFAKLVFQAKIKGDLVSKMKVAVALQTYGTTLNPVMNEFTGRLPLDPNGGPELDHITDYTHHKLLLVDGERFQLGGRNIEDSYHTDNLKKFIAEAGGKYTFMDTDFYGETSEAVEIKKSYERLFNFNALTGDLKRVEVLAPNSYDVHAEQFQKSLGACLVEGKATPKDLETCVDSKIVLAAGYSSTEIRFKKIEKELNRKAAIFKREYSISTDSSWKKDGDHLNPSDLAADQVFYLENLNFTKNNPGKRSFGSDIGVEANYGKYIHSAWVKGLENTCASSATDKRRRRVVLHSAYFFLPSGLVNALGNMMNGRWNCSQVEVILITNSFDTTDLNIINIFARYQLQILLSHSQNIGNINSAKLKYYEYLPAHSGSGISLHTKLSVLGDDVIIGSANADVRSYFMDTNNAVLIRNAPALVQDYNTYIDRIIADNRVVELTDYYSKISNEELKRQNIEILNQMQQKWDKDGKRLTPDRQQRILGYLDDRGQHIKKATQTILNAGQRLDSNYRGSSDDGGRDEYRDIMEIDKTANGFDSMWKIL